MLRKSHAAIALSLCALSTPAPAARGTTSASASTSAHDCPQGFALDSKRAEALVERLRTVNSGRSAARDLSSSASNLNVCFGTTDVSMVSVDNGTVLLLDVRADDRALAARVAHLASHLTQASRFDPKHAGIAAASDCPRWVEGVLHAEAEAFVIELEVARDLGVMTPYAFAPDVDAHSTKTERIDLVATFLRAHPDGSVGIEPLARGYEQRCRDEAAATAAGAAADVK